MLLLYQLVFVASEVGSLRAPSSCPRTPVTWDILVTGEDEDLLGYMVVSEHNILMGYIGYMGIYWDLLGSIGIYAGIY